MRYTVETVAPEGEMIMEGLIKVGVLRPIHPTGVDQASRKKMPIEEAIKAFVGRRSKEEGDAALKELYRSRYED